jgi:hypothetical protein
VSECVRVSESGTRLRGHGGMGVSEGDLGQVGNTNRRDVVDSSFFHRIPRCELNDPRDTDRSSCTDRDGECGCAMCGWAGGRPCVEWAAGQR